MSTNLNILSAKPLAVLALLAVATPSLAADIVTNGGFETGDFTGWTQFGDTSFTSVDAPAAHSGDYGAHFGNRDGGGIMQQTIALTLGATYSLNFWLLGQGDGTFTVAVGDQDLGGLSGFSFPYLPFSGQFVATDAAPELTFTFSSPTGYFELDDISITQIAGPPIPEPASWALMIGGFAVAGASLRQRRRVAVRFA